MQQTPHATDERPDPSAQTRLLVRLVLATAALTILPCLALTFTEATGLTNLLGLLIPPDGTLLVELDDPAATVVVSGRYTAMVIPVSERRSMRPGDYTISVTSTANGQYLTHTETVTIEPRRFTVVEVPWTTVQPAETEPAEPVEAPSLADVPHQSFPGWGASWSPDGSRIVMQSSREIGPDPEGMLQTLHLETGLTRPLVRRGKDPAWSPRADGPIAYVLHGEQREDVWLIDPDGENNRQLVEGGYPSWSADGSILNYHHAPSGTLRSINVDEPAAVPQTVMDCSYLYPSVSPDGSKVVLGEGLKLVVLDIRRGDLLLQRGRPGTRGILAGWTPDSNRIVFGGFGSETDWPLSSLVIAGGELTPLLREPLTMPRISPDGARLVADDRINVTVVVFEMSDLLRPVTVQPDPAGDR